MPRFLRRVNKRLKPPPRLRRLPAHRQRRQRPRQLRQRRRLPRQRHRKEPTNKLYDKENDLSAARARLARSLSRKVNHCKSAGREERKQHNHNQQAGNACAGNKNGDQDGNECECKPVSLAVGQFRSVLCKVFPGRPLSGKTFAVRIFRKMAGTFGRASAQCGPTMRCDLMPVRHGTGCGLSNNASLDRKSRCHDLNSRFPKIAG